MHPPYSGNLSLPYPSTWYQSGKILDLAAALLPHRAAPGEVDLYDLHPGPRRPY
jgi:hypothetical protein